MKQQPEPTTEPTEPERARLTLEVDAGTTEIWRAAAAVLGYMVRSGTYHGQGSISALLSAVAQGKVTEAALAVAFRQARRDLGKVSSVNVEDVFKVVKDD